jgi:diaminopropionate ammonia-lyase
MIRIIHNKNVMSGSYPEDLSKTLGLIDLDQAQDEIESWLGYRVTPLHSLSSMAANHSLGMIYYKDEGPRFNLKSFKALGGAYAVKRLVQRHKDERLTVCCATDGNHGRSVAWGAQRFGCECKIYIHSTVSEGRKRAIEAYGAEVIRTEGNYDDSVRQAAKDAESNGWYVVSDTSYPGYTEIPRDVMSGYMLMANEAFDQCPKMPTHLFLQGGVGGLAAAVLATCWQRYGEARPRFIVVEPDKAPCIAESIEAGERVVVHGDLDTIMAGLACGEVSLIAWDILKYGTHDAVVVDDDAAISVMRQLANPAGSDTPIVAGESATCGLAAALAISKDPSLRDEFGMTSDSRVLVFGTEADTDPELYQKLVGMRAEDVLAWS